MLISLMYVSVAVTMPNKKELTQILKESREKNEQEGITGLLLYNTGTFLQILEGEEEQVDRLFDAIKHDPRHRQVTVLMRSRIAAREFPDWEMRFQDLSDPDSVVGFSSFLEDTAHNKHSTLIQIYLRAFRFKMHARHT